MARGIGSKAKILKRLPKEAQKSLDWDNKTCNVGTVRRIIDSTQQEHDHLTSQPTLNEGE
jgi:hypothetical protein